MFSITGNAQSSCTDGTGHKSGDLVEVATKAGSFGTLVAALEAADLVETLRGDAHFTVFAPTDAAFERLGRDTVHQLLQPQNRDRLRAILTYHVVPGSVDSKHVVAAKELHTVNGAALAVHAGDEVRVGGAKVLKVDIAASNGTIHVIDHVLTPPEAPADLIDVAQRAGNFGTLITAARAAGLDAALRGDGPFTVLAPTDAAFAQLGEEQIGALLKPENIERLQAILKLHVVAGGLSARDAVRAGKAETLQGGKVAFEIVDGQLRAGGAAVIRNDLQASNGVIHVIDTVLLPE